MQWLINEFKQFKVDVITAIDKKFSELPKEDLAERVQKLEGEIRALKARMGKRDA